MASCLAVAWRQRWCLGALFCIRSLRVGRGSHGGVGATVEAVVGCAAYCCHSSFGSLPACCSNARAIPAALRGDVAYKDG
jgi:hypothetical protein